MTTVRAHSLPVTIRFLLYEMLRKGQMTLNGFLQVNGTVM